MERALSQRRFSVNSLEDLNNYGNTQVEFDDDRTPGVTILPETPNNQAVAIFQSQDSLVPNGTEILEIINYDVADVTYTVDTSSISGATVVWSNYPNYMTVSNPSVGVFRISGFKSNEDWELVKNPTLQLPETQGLDFTYTAFITYFGSNTASWDIDVDITPFDVMNFPTSQSFDNNIATPITGNARIYDVTENDIVWTVTLTPSVAASVQSITSAGTGGTTNFNNTTKVFTVTGTRVQVNSHLDSLTFTAPLSAQADFNLVYRATNNTDSRDISRTQLFICNAIRYLGPIGGNISFNEDISFTLTNFPLITDNDRDGTGTYVYTITPDPTTAVRSMANTGTGGSSSFNASTKVLTITGTRSQVNNRLVNTTISPASDYNQNFTLSYNLTAPGDFTNTKTQTVAIAVQHDEVINITTARRYDNDLPNTLFNNLVPQITDLDETNPTYTITLSSAIGKFGTTANNAVSNFSFTGSKTQINAIFPTLVFVPNLNSTGNSTISYTQTKNGVQQVSATAILNGPFVATFPKVTTNQTATVTEGGTITVTPGTQIIATNNPPAVSTYTINVSACPGATVTWSTIPVGLNVSNPSAGFYTLSGILSVAQWEQVRNPIIRLPNTYFGTFEYLAILAYPGVSGTQSLNWYGTITVTDVFPFTTINSQLNYFSGQSYNLSTLGYSPTLVDAGNTTPTWTVTVTPNIAQAVGLFVTDSSQGTKTFNSINKVLTLSGTVAQINSHLSTLNLITPSGQDLDYAITYSASNNLNSETATRTFTLKSINETVLSVVRSPDTYSEGGVVTTVSGGPLIVNAFNGNYTLTITAVPSNAVSKITADYPFEWTTRSTNTVVGDYFAGSSTYSRIVTWTTAGVITLYIISENGDIDEQSPLSTFNVGHPLGQYDLYPVWAGNGLYVMIRRPSNQTVTTYFLSTGEVYSPWSGATSVPSVWSGSLEGALIVQPGYLVKNSSGTTAFNNTSLNNPNSGTTKIVTSNYLENASPFRQTGFVFAGIDSFGFFVWSTQSVQERDIVFFPNASDIALSENGEVIVVSSNANKIVSIYTRDGQFNETVTLQNTFTGTETDFGLKVAVTPNGDGVAIGGKYFYQRQGNQWILRDNINDNATCGEDVKLLFINGNIEAYSKVGTTITVYRLIDAIWNGTAFVKVSDKNTLNTDIDNLKVTPASGYTGNFQLYYSATASGLASTRNQNINKV
jgi:hypothetical protein